MENKTFYGTLNSLKEQFKRKNADYGSSFAISVNKYGLIAAITRISDKFNRYKTLSDKGTSQVNESLFDTLGDMTTYCLMTKAIVDKKEVEEVFDELIWVEPLPIDECFAILEGAIIENKQITISQYCRELAISALTKAIEL